MVTAELPSSRDTWFVKNDTWFVKTSIDTEIIIDANFNIYPIRDLGFLLGNLKTYHFKILNLKLNIKVWLILAKG